MLGNISPVQLGIVLLIVILIFGTRKLRNMGGDIGGGIADFRKGFKDIEAATDDLNRELSA